ncbi:MAG TPA: pitrilysin family protein [Syntrophales bacterium]|nr:pitrilysin family protein [Syntrophales bacterium]HRR48331.1 pitrilysin family protein [Syntrophales bacterium]
MYFPTDTIIRIFMPVMRSVLSLAAVMALVCPPVSAAADGATAGESTALARTGKSFVLPPFEKFTLTNGLTVYLMEHRAVPLIYATAVFPAGAARDGGKSGLAYLTAESLFSGTKHYGKGKLEEELERHGVVYSSYAGLDAAGVSLTFIKDDLEGLFPILREVIQDSLFTPGEFDNRKRRLLDELTQVKEQPELVLDPYYRGFIFGRHPYGNPLFGTYGTVSKIRSADARAFYRAYYRPEGAALIFVGDFSAARMKGLVQQHFGAWRGKGKAPEPPATPPPPVFTSPRVLLVNKDDAAETRFAFGGLGIERNHPDYVAVQVVNTILGGRFTSWLSDALRIDAGLTYGVGSSFDAFKASGTFAISSFTPTDTTVAALTLARDVLMRLHTQGVDEETLRAAKGYLLGQYPLLYETPGSLANLLAAMFIYDFDAAYVNDYHRNLEAVTVAKAKEVIARRFPRDNLQFVLIGKAAALREQVKRFGPVAEKDIKSNGY